MRLEGLPIRSHGPRAQAPAAFCYFSSRSRSPITMREISRAVCALRRRLGPRVRGRRFDALYIVAAFVLSRALIFGAAHLGTHFPAVSVAPGWATSVADHLHDGAAPPS